MGVFSEGPKRFKLDRKSPFASKLKAHISDKLLLFCPSTFHDDVLAEYITVLVCNGKNQNQTRDDLEAFLGEKSRDFVSWLWHHLMAYEVLLASNQDDSSSPTLMDSRKIEKRCAKFRDSKSREYSDSDKLLVEDEDMCRISANGNESNEVIITVDCHPPSPKRRKRDVQSKSSQAKPAKGAFCPEVPPFVGKSLQGKLDRSKEPASSKGRHLTNLPGRGHRFSPRLSHDHKRSGLSPMHNKENSLRSRLSLPWASSFRNKSKGSVWDRLGKSTQGVLSRVPIRQTPLMNMTNRYRKLADHFSRTANGFARRKGQLSPLPGNRRNMREVHHCAVGGEAKETVENRGMKHVGDTVIQMPAVSNDRKQQSRELGIQTDTGMATRQGADVENTTSCGAVKRKVIPPEASQAIISQVQDMRLRMRQVELEMMKLRFKQIEIKTDGKTNLLASSGLVKPSEDIESRTVLVCNVHEKATKEALSMLFQKCGAVANVNIFTDSQAIGLHRSAYITFGSKESADKAMGLNGTTFYSRTIKVSKKRSGTSASSIQSAEKRIRHVPQPVNVPSSPQVFQRQYLASTQSASPTLASNPSDEAAYSLTDTSRHPKQFVTSSSTKIADGVA